MITAQDMLMETLANDYNFQQILTNIKNSARGGSYQYYHNSNNYGGDGSTERRYVEGLKNLGFKAEMQGLNIQISWG